MNGNEQKEKETNKNDLFSISRKHKRAKFALYAIFIWFSGI